MISSFPAVPAQPESGLVLNEIYYDHDGSDSGYEYVEIYNNSQLSECLDGVCIEFVDGRTAESSLFYSFLPGESIEPGSVVIAGGGGFGGSREPYCSLQNGPDAVFLRRHGELLDRIGYGDLDSEELFEGDPAPDPGAGSSLARKPDGADSDNNRLDFVPAGPSPGEINFYLNDLELSLGSRGLYPCRNSISKLGAEIINRGMEEFEGTVRLYLKQPCTDSFLIDLKSFEPGASTVEKVNIAIPAAEVFTLEVRLYAPGDENNGNNTVRVLPYSSPGPVIINELLYRPEMNGSEWIELLNRSGSAVNIQGWTISDANNRNARITSGDIILQPGCFLVLAQRPEEIEIPGVPVTGVEGGWPALNDYPGEGEREKVILRDGAGRIVDRTAYIDLLEGERGRSIERISPVVCSSYDGGIWHRCSSAAGSTPGERNTAYGSFSASLSISPNPFCLSRDKEVEISGRVKEGMEGFLVRIFSITGLEVRRIFGEKKGALNFSCRWNGSDGAGDPVRTGLFICVAEYFSGDGYVAGREKRCIAVSAECR